MAGKKRYVMTPPRGSILLEVCNLDALHSITAQRHPRHFALSAYPWVRHGLGTPSEPIEIVRRKSSGIRLSRPPMATTSLARSLGMTSLLVKWLEPSRPAKSSYSCLSGGSVSSDHRHVISPPYTSLKGYSQIDGNLATTAAGMTLNGTPNDLIQWVSYSPNCSFVCESLCLGT